MLKKDCIYINKN